MGPSFAPFTLTGVPDSNPISTSSALSGAFSGDTVHCHMASLGAQVPDIAVATVNVLLALLNRHLVLFRVGDGVFARIDRPLAPRRNDLQVRGDRLVGEFETHLVV